ncbi:MAG TPA: GGDEF domain-containing protein [Candidatus Acidoferrales bacterium]|nr:GGDEF domain-containing protein [Candidatus Acidoferrales bacterium]
MPVQSSPRNNEPHPGQFKVHSHNPASNRKAPSIHGRRGPSDKDLEGALSSALLAADKEFGHILHEVDEISEALKSNSPDTDTLRVALHPAVWCAVKEVLLDRELRYLALTDDLTCLYNRRGFFAAATQQMKVARRNGKGMLLLFCDVDDLKAINDCYGHREGDLALVRTADALEEAFRDSDILARLGGDEFAVVALDVADEDQRVMLRRLEECLNMSNAEEPRYKLSLSVGAVRFDPQGAASLGELIERADKAMYEQKRNRPKPCLSNA